MTNIKKNAEIGSSKRLSDCIKKFSKKENLNKVYIVEGKNIQIQCQEIAEEGIGSFVLLLSDISLIKDCEAARTEAKHKEMLMATVTHELRTPTNATLSMLQVLKEKDQLDEEGRNFIQIAINSCFLLLNLINDILVLLTLFFFFFIRTFQN